MNGIKVRKFPEKNYKSIFCDNKTMRFTYNPKEPIKELDYPEFYDVKVTNKCNGGCSWCYQDSKMSEEHDMNILKKFDDIFRPMTVNEKPFQIAFGGGEPTLHPDFCKLMELCYNLDIMPNYTTNGTNITEEILDYTKKYCGGVALSCHSHLRKHWETAFELLHSRGINTNFHNIISDKESVDEFIELYKKYNGRIYYFVLLPYSVTGRAKEMDLAFDYLFDQLKELKKTYDISNIAFGANFYEMLKKHRWLDAILYEPHLMSGYIELTDNEPILYKSSFDLTPRQWGVTNSTRFTD